MKPDILLSIRPKWSQLILSGEKTVELRRRVPTKAFRRVYFYETRPTCKVVCMAEATIISAPLEEFWEQNGFDSRVTKEEYLGYFEGCSSAHGLALWNVRRVRPFMLAGHAPQGWIYGRFDPAPKAFE